MKTQEEIRARYDAIAQPGEVDHADPLGWRRTALIEAMDYDTAKDLIVEDVTPEDWPTPDVAAKARRYVVLGIGKAFGHRGLSAERTVEKLTEWLWVLEDEALAEQFDDTGYPQYGAPKLAVLAEAWDIEHEHAQDPDWLRMVEGRPCTDECMEGCANE